MYTLLTDQEIAEVTKVTCEHVAGRVVVVAADNMWPTGKEVEFALYAKEVGADILMVLPPNWGNSCTPETFATHYSLVAEQIPVMMVTNIFISLSFDFVFKLLEIVKNEIDGVIAIKDDYGGAFGKRLANLSQGKWSMTISGAISKDVYQFPKESFLDVMAYGYDGYISNYLMFKPDIAHEYWKTVKTGDLSRAREIISTYEISLGDFMKTFKGGADAVVRGQLELFGVIERWRRPPYYNLTDDDMERIAHFFKGLSLL